MEYIVSHLLPSPLSSPNHEIQIDLVPTFGANGTGHRDSALFTVRADIRIEQDFHVIAESGTTLAARLMNELEILYFPASWTTIVRNDLNLTIGNVLLG